MSTQPDTIDQEHIDAAVEEEQTRLRNFMQQQQTTYLLNRCIELNAQTRAAAAAPLEPSDDDGIRTT